MKDYCVVHSTSSVELEWAVKEKLLEGWLPQGGTGVAIGVSQVGYYQAMVLPYEED